MTTRVRNLTSSLGEVNNSRRSVLKYSQDDGFAYEAATISAVNSTNSFDDSATSLPLYAAGQVIEVTGLESNSRTYKVVSCDGTSLVVEGATVTDESAGATVTIRTV